MTTPAILPYKIACLCDLRDRHGRVLLLRRTRSPNQGLCSPIGGKLHMNEGESPARCAQREILEEAGIEVPLNRLHLAGLISEAGYEGAGHWLLMYYRVIGPVEVEEKDIPEGRLEWHDPKDIDALPLPDTDRSVIWPMIRKHEPSGPNDRPGLFCVHIDCTGTEMAWTIDQEAVGIALPVSE